MPTCGADPGRLSWRWGGWKRHPRGFPPLCGYFFRIYRRFLCGNMSLLAVVRLLVGRLHSLPGTPHVAFSESEVAFCASATAFCASAMMTEAQKAEALQREAASWFQKAAADRVAAEAPLQPAPALQRKATVMFQKAAAGVVAGESVRRPAPEPVVAVP